MSEPDYEYEYQPKWRLILLCGALFAAGAVVLAYEATRNERELRILGLIELSTVAATSFYWVLCSLCGAFVAVAALMAVARLSLRQRIALLTDRAILPRSAWSSEEVAIHYDAITNLSTEDVFGQRFLQVTHAGGTHTINAAMMPSPAAFDELRELLTIRARAGWLKRGAFAKLDNQHIIADYRRRFRRGPIGFWYTRLGGGFEMTHGTNLLFNADGTGTCWSWDILDESPNRETVIEWRSVGDCRIEARKQGEGAWELVTYDFRLRLNEYDIPEVCIFQPDHWAAKHFGDPGFWWSGYPLVHGETPKQETPARGRG
jgi:hypothetical protein